MFHVSRSVQLTAIWVNATTNSNKSSQNNRFALNLDTHQLHSIKKPWHWYFAVCSVWRTSYHSVLCWASTVSCMCVLCTAQVFCRLMSLWSCVISQRLTRFLNIAVPSRQVCALWARLLTCLAPQRESMGEDFLFTVSAHLHLAHRARFSFTPSWSL